MLWTRRLTLLTTQAMIFLVLAEVAALAYHFYDTGTLFYKHRREYPVFGETERGELTDQDEDERRTRKSRQNMFLCSSCFGAIISASWSVCFSFLHGRSSTGRALVVI